MIDIHSHILPGLDDGSPDDSVSLKMAALAVGDGIREIIATPHVTETLSREDIASSLADFQELLNDRKIPLKVHLGGEVPFDLLRKMDVPLTLAGSRYILVEFLPEWIPHDAEDVFRNFILQGYRIIIAHPERNRAFMQNTELLKNLLMPGVHLQLTAMALKGSFGPSVKFFAHALLRQGSVDFIASDAHDHRLRKPELSFLLTSGKNKKLYPALDQILHRNPEKLFKNGCEI
ncbi:protein-tyrosine phosphatase [Desulfobotulus alkaliphilus]|uniref:protein-tyrosine-phosphatase n=1 Tax=Desulfobotulus alkaliphilus TaxID=622671 RepID=A0A562RIM8_9BACT|nr:CpsB/CapC family capsule biosynthesis tyrosine phosphatase [Desulfobotulus alkaliphilus]TWI68200.1 protein-tyrosine phosphatase [Desulfobotulus alkaliphilus]